MTKSNLSSGINVKTVNKLMLILLTLWFLPMNQLPEWLFPNQNISDSVHSYGVILVIVFLLILLKPKAIKEFFQDPRFKTAPGWRETVTVIGINYAVTIGLAIFLLGLLGFLLPNMGEISEMPTATNQAPYLPYNQITETFDLVSGSINFLAMVIIVPFYEELLFRGLALRAYEKARSPIFAAIFTALLFSLFHLNLIQFLFLIPSSFIMARAVQVFGSWWIAVILHVIQNGLIFFIYSFSFTSETITENPISLWTGLLGLIIATVAFGVAMYWFKTHDRNKIPLTNQKPMKIFTPSLTIFVFLCFVLTI